MHLHRLLHIAWAALLVLAAAVLISACGGSNKPPRSAANGPSHGKLAINAYRYSDCMRTHGVTNFQDPHVSNNGNGTQISVHIDPAISSSPSFRSAQKACAHILPGLANGPTPAQQHAHEQAMLAFARCMRRHGFGKFPDPTAQGQLTLAMITSAGIDLQQPAVKPAAYACAPLTHGLLTKADINQAIANPSASGSQQGAGG